MFQRIPYEYFKELHIGLISEVPRKSLPSIARVVGEADSQDLHHFVVKGHWQVEGLREKRLMLLKAALGERTFMLCIDETGDKKKGNSTDYTARQYIGNLGKLENGVVSVNAYGVLDKIPFPLLFKIFKPEKCLNADDVYRTKPQLAIELIQELRAMGFVFDVVLADRLYGESGTFIEALRSMKLKFVVALRDNHGVWLDPDERIRYTRWRTFQRVFSDESTQTRYICEVIYGRRGYIRYYFVTTDPVTLPAATTCLLMTNLQGSLRHTLGNIYGLRTYGFKHIKNELGWAHYRLTDYPSIQRWWELVLSAYLMVSLQTSVLQSATSPLNALDTSVVAHHSHWQSRPSWKQTLNNLPLLIQPFVAFCLLLPWLSVFTLPALATNLQRLVASINTYTYPVVTKEG